MVLLIRIILITTNREVSLVEMLDAFSQIKEGVGGIREIEVFPSIRPVPPHFVVTILFEAEKAELSEMAKVLEPVGHAMLKMDFIKKSHGFFLDATHYA